MAQADTKKTASGDRAESATKVETKVYRKDVIRSGKRVEVNGGAVRETR